MHTSVHARYDELKAATSRGWVQTEFPKIFVTFATDREDPNAVVYGFCAYIVRYVLLQPWAYLASVVIAIRMVGQFHAPHIRTAQCRSIAAKHMMYQVDIRRTWINLHWCNLCKASITSTSTMMTIRRPMLWQLQRARHSLELTHQRRREYTRFASYAAAL